MSIKRKKEFARALYDEFFADSVSVAVKISARLEKEKDSLRYFKSAALQKLFGDINVAINNVRYRNEQEYQFFADPIKPFIVKNYDFKGADKLRKPNPETYNMDLISQYRKGNTFIKADILNLSTFNRGEAEYSNVL